MDRNRNQLFILMHVLINNRNHPTLANENQAHYLIRQATKTISTRIFHFKIVISF